MGDKFEQITNAEKRNLVLQTLNSLMMEQDVNEFTNSLDRFLVRLQTDPETSSFHQYFNKNYVDNVRIWAQCYRKNVPIHTNMSLEAFHKNMKYNYRKVTRNQWNVMEMRKN